VAKIMGEYAAKDPAPQLFKETVVNSFREDIASNFGRDEDDAKRAFEARLSACASLDALEGLVRDYGIVSDPTSWTEMGNKAFGTKAWSTMTADEAIKLLGEPADSVIKRRLEGVVGLNAETMAREVVSLGVTLKLERVHSAVFECCFQKPCKNVYRRIMNDVRYDKEQCRMLTIKRGDTCAAVMDIFPTDGKLQKVSQDLLSKLRPRSLVMLSATLRTCGDHGIDFTYALKFIPSEWLEDTSTLLVPSRFEATQCKFWTGRRAYFGPKSSQYKYKNYIGDASDALLRVVQANGANGTMVLVFNNEAAADLRSALVGKLGTRNLPEDCTTDDLQEHRDRVDAGRGSVMFGTSKHATGVDLPRQYLTALFIANLPNAKFEEYHAEFYKHHSPSNTETEYWNSYFNMSTTTMRQAVGRLVRTERDRGVVFVYDRRFRDQSNPRAQHYQNFFAMHDLTRDVSHAVDLLPGAWPWG